MKKVTEYLDPGRKLVDETADWLCGSERYGTKIEAVPGCERSLGHILVVAPTAQSARNLRLAIAKRAEKNHGGGIIPPRTVMADSLLVPADERIATQAEEFAAMACVLMECDIAKYPALFPKPPAERSADWALSMAGTILGVSSILADGAMLMGEVKPQFEEERWKNLGEIENLFIAKLEKSGVTPGCAARRKAIAAGCKEEGITHIVLPSATDVKPAFVKYLENSAQNVTVLVHASQEDAEKFDEWGRPQETFKAEIPADMIFPAPNSVHEADGIAKYFREVAADEALPALVVCDSDMYPELEGAFQNHFGEDELVLRNPSREKVRNSALGRLLGAILQLASSRDYETFSTFVRMGDVARWARGALGVSGAKVARYLGVLDEVQNERLPQTIDDAIAGAAAHGEKARYDGEREAAEGLKRLAEAVDAELKDPFGFLKKIFASLSLDEKRPGDRELIAAAETVRNLREDCASTIVPENLRRKLFMQLLKNATYMLEPTAPNVLAAGGWLEASWCAEDEVVFAGFNEGCVPSNIVGHPFVPDSLRTELGLSTNASREARDSFIFAQAVRCRGKGCARVWLHQISSDKNVMKPSRILFGGIPDGELPDLALRLYAVTKGNEGAPAKEIPAAWRIKLPFPPEGLNWREKISITKIDSYIRCPFGFYLAEVMGDGRDDRVQEIDKMRFGTLCHEALDAFAKEGPKDSTDENEIAEFLEAQMRRLLEQYGKNLPAIIEVQGADAIERLKAFAAIQAKRRASGWRISSSEQMMECRIKGCPTLLRGKVDRIDVHEETGDIAVIDYKTWSYPKEDKYKNSIQLAAYRAMVQTSGEYDPEKARTAKAFYCVLGSRPENVTFFESHACGEGEQSGQEDEIVKALERIARGIFWPEAAVSPAQSKYKMDKTYEKIVSKTPGETIDPKWIEDQMARMEGME